MTAGRSSMMAKPAAAAGGTTITESFNKADSDTLGPDLTWTETTGDLDIVSNQCKNSGAAAGEARAESDLSTGNHYAQAVFYKNGSIASTRILGVLTRFSSSARTHYYLLVYADDTYIVGKRVAGTGTTLVSGSVTWANGDVFRLEVNGSVLVAKQNGTQFATTTNSDITTGTRCGVYILQTTCTLDSFQAGDL